MPGPWSRELPKGSELLVGRVEAEVPGTVLRVWEGWMQGILNKLTLKLLQARLLLVLSSKLPHILLELLFRVPDILWESLTVGLKRIGLPVFGEVGWEDGEGIGKLHNRSMALVSLLYMLDRTTRVCHEEHAHVRVAIVHVEYARVLDK